MHLLLRLACVVGNSTCMTQERDCRSQHDVFAWGSPGPTRRMLLLLLLMML